MNLHEYLDRCPETNLHRISQGSGVSYTTLHAHIRHGRRLAVETAKRLEAWSLEQPAAEQGFVMSAAEILGLSAPRHASGTMPKVKPPKTGSED